MKLGSLLKSHFIAGLFIVIPFGVIAWIFLFVMQMLWQLHLFFPESWQPDSVFQDPTMARFFNLLFVIAATLLIAILISFLGWSSKHFLGKKALEFLGEIIERIPVIRSIYSALDQLLKTISAGGGQQFSRVVYLEYPRKGIWAIGFVTSNARGYGIPENHLNIYLPTTPNPTSGFHLIVPESEVRESHMKVEEAFKTLLSLGIAQHEAK